MTAVDLMIDTDSQAIAQGQTVYIQYEHQLPISQAERKRRQQAWSDTLANFSLEGIHPSDEMSRIGQMYINGKITLEQQGEMMRQAILAAV